MGQTQASSYIIQGGQEGADRLKVLAEATWPTTEPFLREAGLCPGARCLDVGCGNGDLSLRLASLLGGSGELVGVDFDPRVIKIARQNAAQANRPVRFRVLDIEKEGLGEQAYDFIYARFLLSHLRQPEAALRRMRTALRPGGILAVEDVDFRGHFCHPECPAFDRYVELYRQTGIAKGVDPLIGPRLPELLESGGLADVRLRVVLPTFRSGVGKRLALLTMNAIQGAVVAAGLADAGEVQRILAELGQFSDDPRTIISAPRIFQVWGSTGSEG
jgi:SAM-dependent methyltransferase